MPAPDLSRSPDKRLLGYRFAGVVLDLRRQTLSVDDAEVASTPLMLKLMQLLCESDGQLLKRQDLFDKLWPGGQEVSDSSLSQLVWRLRGALGPYGESVATVRRSGLRLDASVTPEFDFQRLARKPSADEDTEQPRPMRVVEMAPPVVPVAAPAPAEEIAPKASARKYGLLAGALALLLLALAAAYWWWPTDVVVSPSYDLRASDVQASRKDTPRLMAAAFAADSAGERSHALALMKSLHESDPTTPVPALMVAWWSGDRTNGDVEKWLDAAQRRLTSQSSPYMRLFSDYFTARSKGHSTRGPINAMLDLRPHAWVLQYARAHDQLGARELAGALRSLQQIPLDIPDTAQVAEVLADRRSLGDASAQALAAQNKAIQDDPVLSAYERGRMAYSRGDLAESIAAFDQCRNVAEEHREYSRQSEVSLFGALAALEAGRADVAQRVDATVRLAHEQNIQSWEASMLGLQAFLEARSGNADRAGATLAHAWERNPVDWLQPPLLLIAFENGLPAPGDAAAVAQALPSDPVFGGVAELVLGWQAWSHNDLALAKRQLALAREHGVAHTYHAEDAALLGARLGEAPVPCRVDPPYPNELRLSACISLREMKKP